MIELAIIFLILAVLAKPIGVYVAFVYMGRKTLLSKALKPFESLIYKLVGTTVEEEMSWPRYANALLIFSALGFALLYFMLLFVNNLSPDLAFNIAISFITNTNWQSYTGEESLSNFSQIFGLGVQQFVSAATGMAVAVAIFRAFASKNSKTIGNFWVDLTRGILYILLPLALIYSAALTLGGVPQTFEHKISTTTLEGNSQEIATGSIASMMAIKQLGTNGGGFMGANSAHPFENPNPFTNVIQFIAILLLPVAFVYAFGVISGHRKQALALYMAILLIIAPMFAAALYQEMQLPEALLALSIDSSAGNMEGKEVRIGALNSAAWGVAATITGNGSANSAYGSLKPLTTIQQLLPMMLGEITFGGVGSGMVSLLMYVLVTVFIGGLMVGRTPELMGKKLGAFEVKLASLIIVIPATIILVGTAVAVVLEAGIAGISNHGIHGYTEILYAFSSAAANNGSGMAGLASNSPFYNSALGISMFMGRYFILVSSLALAGALSAKNTIPVSNGTIPTHGILFICMFLIVVLLVGVLNYVPAIAIGPMAEHVLMAR